VRAAIRRHFAPDRDLKGKLSAAIDLAGQSSTEDEPSASAFWLPMFEAMDRQDSLFRRTVKAIPGESPELVRQVARLLGPDGQAVLEWLRRAPLHDGVAAELVDEQGIATANGGDAALSGLLAATAWYAVHALGITG
jgi:hypothetical protein